jgi:hypothetical protein
MLAGAKTLGAKDGDYFAPGQQGIFCVTKLIWKINKKKAKQTVIIVGKIIESHAKDADGKVQNPGTKVKQMYLLSKYDWAIDRLKTDLLRMAGIDEKTVSEEELETMFDEAFGKPPEDPKDESGICVGGELLGVCVAFDTSTIERTGKTSITNITFREVSSEEGQMNHPDKIAERRKELAEEVKQGK